MLQTLSNEGHLSHTCDGCGGVQATHISHEQVQFFLMDGSPKEHRTVGLPACDCGSRKYLKVDFTPEELSASNMIDANGNPTESYQAAQRHMQLARQMEALGKRPRQTHEAIQQGGGVA